MSRLRGEMDDRLSRFDAREARPALAVSYPALNGWEDDDAFYAEAELPGMELADLEIFVTGGNQLTIKGERKVPEYENATWHRQERGFGAFSRVLTLPLEVDADRVSAELSHGVLSITMPKAEVAKPRRIPVKAD
jgi:HSP20 family protein